MRVGLSIRTVYDSQGNPRQKDGIGVYTENILKSLSNQKQQHDIEIIPCYQKNINELLQKTSNKYKSLTNIFMKGLLPNIPWYKKLENDIDIYHSTDYIIPKLKDTPVIATLHDAIMFKDKTMSNKKYRKLKNFLLKKHAKFADHIITLSQTVKQDIVEYWGIPEKKISVIYCPIDPIWFETIAPEKREKILAKHSIYKPFFLAVGTLQPRKNFLRIIEAFEKIDKQYPGEFGLVIVGKVGWLCDDIVSKIEKLTNKINIKWLKYIAHEDLRALYQSAMALVFPSLEEGFGYPIIEAFASKTQVITSNYGSMHEIAKGYGYLVNPSKVEAITSAMYEVINSNLSTFDKNSSILNAYKYTKKFNWENHISKLVNVYTRV